MKRCITLAAVALLLLVTASCATIGRQFPKETVPRIKTGTTTMQEVKEMFGSPWRTGLDSGQKTWTYGYYKYRLLGETTTSDLVVRFNERGIVESYTYNTSEPDE